MIKKEDIRDDIKELMVLLDNRAILENKINTNYRQANKQKIKPAINKIMKIVKGDKNGSKPKRPR